MAQGERREGSVAGPSAGWAALPGSPAVSSAAAAVPGSAAAGSPSGEEGLDHQDFLCDPFRPGVATELVDQATEVLAFAGPRHGEVRLLTVCRELRPSGDVTVQPDPEHPRQPGPRRKRPGAGQPQRQRIHPCRAAFPSAELAIDLPIAALAEELTRQVPP